jgi:hypothetical protein
VRLLSEALGLDPALLVTKDVKLSHSTRKHLNRLINLMTALRAGRIAAFAFGAALVLGCGAEPATPAELCAALLESKRPGAEVVASTAHGEGRLELVYELPEEADAPAEGSLTCEVERSALGGARLRAAHLDGRALSETELVVRNANLLLDELYALGSRRG